MRFFRRRPRLSAIDDVLELSTKYNLEHHAEKAADKAEDLLDKAVKEEAENQDEMNDAINRFQLSRARRIMKQGLANSVASVLENLRK